MTRFLVFLSHLSLVDVAREWAVHELAPRGESCPVAKVAGGRVGALQHVAVFALVQGNAAVAGAGDLKLYYIFVFTGKPSWTIFPPRERLSTEDGD